MLFLILCFISLLFSFPAFAQELSNEEFFNAVGSSLGGIKGASALTIAAMGVQLGLMFFRTPMANFKGHWKMIVVGVLTAASGTLALMTTGVDFGPAVFNSGAISVLILTIHNFWKQKKKHA